MKLLEDNIIIYFIVFTSVSSVKAKQQGKKNIERGGKKREASKRKTEEKGINKKKLNLGFVLCCHSPNEEWLHREKKYPFSNETCGSWGWFCISHESGKNTL